MTNILAMGPWMLMPDQMPAQIQIQMPAEEYEGIQSDIFDHILTKFNLRLFQNPTGTDFQVQGLPGSKSG